MLKMLIALLKTYANTIKYANSSPFSLNFCLIHCHSFSNIRQQWHMKNNTQHLMSVSKMLSLKRIKQHQKYIRKINSFKVYCEAEICCSRSKPYLSCSYTGKNKVSTMGLGWADLHFFHWSHDTKRNEDQSRVFFPKCVIFNFCC